MLEDHHFGVGPHRGLGIAQGRGHRRQGVPSVQVREEVEGAYAHQGPRAGQPRVAAGAHGVRLLLRDLEERVVGAAADDLGVVVQELSQDVDPARVREGGRVQAGLGA